MSSASARARYRNRQTLIEGRGAGRFVTRLLLMLFVVALVISWWFSLLDRPLAWLWGVPYYTWIYLTVATMAARWAFKNRHRKDKLIKRSILVGVTLLFWKTGLLWWLTVKVWGIPFWIAFLVLALALLVTIIPFCTSMSLSPWERQRNLALGLTLSYLVLGAFYFTHYRYIIMWERQLQAEGATITEQIEALHNQPCANQSYQDASRLYKTNARCELEWVIGTEKGRQNFSYHLFPHEKFAEESAKSNPLETEVVTDASDPERGGKMIEGFNKFKLRYLAEQEQQIRVNEGMFAPRFWRMMHELKFWR